MKINRTYSFILLPLIAYALSSATLRAYDPPNGGFESGGDGVLSAWTLDGKPIPEKDGVASPGNVRALWDAGSRGNGTRCLRMETEGKSGDEFALVGSAPLKLLPGFEYEVSFFYKAEGLLPESGDRSKYAALIVDIFCNAKNQRIGGERIMTYTNSAGWGKLSKKFVIPPGTEWSQVRIQLANKFPGNKVSIWIDDVSCVPTDASLPNSGFEAVEADGAPVGWTPFGGAKSTTTSEVFHGGKMSAAVADAPDGLLSGWATIVPVRSDRRYSFSGFVKGGNLAANGFVGGGALSMEFLDSDGQPVSKRIVSPAVPANTDWTRVSTAKSQAPAGACAVRLVCGLEYCNGTAWFDDLEFGFEEAAAKDAVMLARDAKPDQAARYATNLLKNGTIEEGADGKPSGWTYVGRSAPDWTKEEISRLHTNGRPEFPFGRGRGEWSHDLAYSGKGALLNISIDPPLSPNKQWYGRNPVDGYWFSDPMPCAPGTAYLSSAWIRPGAAIAEAWYGPLELQFFDKNNRQLAPKNGVRSGLDGLPPGVWSYWVAGPWVAPDNAATMRLRFGQEFQASSGGWGRTYADNLAVWKLGDTARIPTSEEIGLRTEAFREWYLDGHAQIKPPYLPAPSSATEYETCWGKMLNATIGNLFYSPDSPAALTFQLANLLGERRDVSLKITRYDWLGAASQPVEVKGITLSGYGEAKAVAVLPPTKSYGSFFLEVEVIEGQAVVGRFSGRYAEMPPLERPRTVENIWGVTPLVPIFGDGRPFEREMGEMMRRGGFGLAWVRLFANKLEPEPLRAELAKVKSVLIWYRSLGIRPVLQMGVEWRRPVDRKLYEQAGKIIAEECNGLVAAYGNHGIEQANSASPYRGGGKTRLTDDDYDTIMAGVYDGIRSVDKETPVLIGNIATDWEGKTIRRLYGKTGGGKFDGAVLNAYMGILMTAQNSLKEFDAHGDKAKTVWQEETAEQRSPAGGESRRYGEADGPKNMVRTWLSMAGNLGPRLKAMTQWGFATSGQGDSDGGDIFMLTATLQPRPHFVAHAVMSDALADATLVGNRSIGDVSIFEWARSDGPIFAVWANAGERAVTFEVPAGKFTVMDLMGNRTEVQAEKGIATLKVTPTPAYVFGGGAMVVSTRLEAKISHGDKKPGEPTIRLTIKNNDKLPIKGMTTFTGPVLGETTASFEINPGESSTFERPVNTKDLPAGSRTTFSAECKTEAGAVYASTSGLNFAQAVKASTPPSLDGSWKGWETSPPITFGLHPDQIRKPTPPDKGYTGPDDITGKFRLMWDDKFLYLGVEALDDVFVPQPERGQSGFMGDSIEFAFQPDNLMTQQATRYEFELYLPNGKPPFAASRRFPVDKAGMVDTWTAAVSPTGKRGDVNYQVAIPGGDIGIEKPSSGKTLSFALVLNDCDTPGRFSGNRGRILWFGGLDGGKNPEMYGDVTLVEP